MATAAHTKKVCRRRSLIESLTLLGLFYSSASAAFAGDPVFDAKCAGCHTIGGGAMVGPDLAPAAKWDAPVLRKSIKDMEKNVGALSDDEVDSLIRYLKNPAPAASKQSSGTENGSGSKAQEPGVGGPDKSLAAASAGSVAEANKSLAVSPAGTDAEPNNSATVAPLAHSPEQTSPLGSAKNGAALFNGEISFKNGGLSCIACHQAEGRGGNMGPDLTNVAVKMPGPALTGACERTPYKVMKVAYRDHPITHQEALDLSAYLTALKNAKPSLKEAPVPLYSGAIAGLVLVLIAFDYRNRNTGIRARLKRRD